MSFSENNENELHQQKEEAGLRNTLLESRSARGNNYDDDDGNTRTTTPIKTPDTNNNHNYGAITPGSCSKNNDNASVSGSGNRKNNRDAVTYFGLLSTNKNFRYYWLSYVVNRMVRAIVSQGRRSIDRERSSF